MGVCLCFTPEKNYFQAVPGAGLGAGCSAGLQRQRMFQQRKGTSGKAGKERSVL